MIDLSQYKAVIFDWDGTLVDTCGLVLDAHNHVRKHYDYAEWSMDDFLGQASKSAREYYPEIYGNKSDEAQIILYDYVEEHHLSYLKAMDQAQVMLEMVSLPMALVSNKRHKFLHIEVKTMGWAHHFKSMIGAGHAEKDKPSSIPLLLAIAEIDPNLQPSDILYVGDTETDLLTAQNTGCPVALLQPDKPRPDLIEKYNPDYAFNDLKEFAAAVTVDNAPANKQAM